MGRKLGGLCPLFGGGSWVPLYQNAPSFFGGGAEAGSPSCTVWPGLKPTFMIPSGILINPAVWLQ